MIIKNVQYVFPFQQIMKGDHVVIWGAGNVGQSFVKQILATGYCVLDGIIDLSAKIGKNLFSVPVFLPDIYPWKRGTTCIIAMSNHEEAEKVRNQLISFGVDDNHIIHSVNCYLDKRVLNDNLFHLPPKEFYEELFRLLKKYKVNGKKYVRIGGKHDGGYVMINDFHNGGIAYSFGINNDVSWDFDMSNMGYDVYMYDHTISHLPYDIPSFHFFPKGIAGHMETKDLLFLDTLLHLNGHYNQNDMILKMDVEGAEWDFITRTDARIFKKFKQIVFEFHGLLDGNLREVIISALNKLNMTHQVVHIHGNNYSNSINIEDKTVPDAMEVTYAIKDAYIFEYDDVILPIPQDAPCCEYESETVLGRWF